MITHKFIEGTEIIKKIKYSSKFAPDFIMTSSDNMVNFSFNILNEKDGDIKAMGNQFQKMPKNIMKILKIKYS